MLGRTAGDDGGFYKQDGSVLPESEDASARAGFGDLSQTVSRRTRRKSSDMLADRRLILVTDLGIIIKDNADGTHDVFVQSIKTGEPVDGAQIDVLGEVWDCGGVDEDG